MGAVLFNVPVNGAHFLFGEGAEPDAVWVLFVERGNDDFPHKKSATSFVSAFVLVHFKLFGEVDKASAEFGLAVGAEGGGNEGEEDVAETEAHKKYLNT